MSGDKYFHRGKEARGHGLPREILDGRMSAESRQQFLAGWDEQDRLSAPPPTQEQLDESARVRSKLRDFVKRSRAVREDLKHL